MSIISYFKNIPEGYLVVSENGANKSCCQAGIQLARRWVSPGIPVAKKITVTMGI